MTETSRFEQEAERKPMPVYVGPTSDPLSEPGYQTICERIYGLLLEHPDGLTNDELCSLTPAHDWFTVRFIIMTLLFRGELIGLKAHRDPYSIYTPNATKYRLSANRWIELAAKKDNLVE